VVNGRFPGRVDKPVPECQTILDLIAAKDEGSGPVGN